MNHNAIVRTPKAPAACLAIELRRVPDDLRDHLYSWMWAFAERWAYDHEQQPPATLWMKDEWTTGADGYPELHLACSSKLPRHFLTRLAEHLNQWIERALKDNGRMKVDADEQWVPLFHWQDGKVWNQKDLDNWPDRDQTPVPHAPPAPEYDNGITWYVEPTRYSPEELNTRAFQAACESGDREDLGEYLEENRNILDSFEAFAKGTTPLHLAAAQADVEACEALLRYVSESVPNSHYQTPLMHLASSRAKKSFGPIVSLLHSTVHHRDPQGRTALMLAANGRGISTRLGNLALIKALVASGADVCDTDEQGYSALGWARKNLHPKKPDANKDVIQWLEKRQYEKEVEQFFRRNYEHHFDEMGVMQIVSRTR
ncbi:ankyrin repeat domain-containing protein [Pseudomonas baetica]|uniref:ankyrin repeat domain-containing protein n=1 Tax=Pseudomonas baetica TaxID=674054 RepID=UPI003EECB2D8